jgi:hypothetical protein
MNTGGLNAMNEQQSPTPKVEAPLPKGVEDLQRIDCLLEKAEVPLSEAVTALQYPEVYLQDSKSLEKLRAEVERVEGYLLEAKDLAESATLFGDLYDDDEFKS